MSTTTVSAKISKKLRERLREKDVNVSSVVRSALEKELARREEEDLKQRLDSLSKSLTRKISKQDVVSAVRSSRDER
jgi:antitoxin CcdA